MALINLQELTMTYGTVTALDRINLQTDSRAFGLLGPNGSGKTTLMRIMATILDPVAGRGEILGVPLSDKRSIREILGYLPQSFGFPPRLSVLETLCYFAALKGVTSPSRLGEVLELVSLESKQKVPVHHLSGGQRQRLGIAVALLNDPRILIVDEPTAGLDPESRIAFRNLLASLPGDRLLVLSSHIVEDLTHSCAELAVLRKGSLLFQGPPEALMRLAEGKVWSVRVEPEALDALRRTHLVVSSVREERHLRCRVLGDPLPGAAPLSPTLEDGYILVSQGGEEV
jgi:ABC-2 type transport system ATP-binding protein